MKFDGLLLVHKVVTKRRYDSGEMSSCRLYDIQDRLYYTQHNSNLAYYRSTTNPGSLSVKSLSQVWKLANCRTRYKWFRFG